MAEDKDYFFQIRIGWFIIMFINLMCGAIGIVVCTIKLKYFENEDVKTGFFKLSMIFAVCNLVLSVLLLVSVLKDNKKYAFLYAFLSFLSLFAATLHIEGNTTSNVTFLIIFSVFALLCISWYCLYGAYQILQQKSYEVYNVEDDQVTQKTVGTNECKEKWKNLLSVFVRHMKPLPSDSGTKTKKPYYLADAMKFAHPFIKTLGTTAGNLPPAPQQTTVTDLEEDSTVSRKDIGDDEESLPQDSPTPSPETLRTFVTQVPTTSKPQHNEANVSQKIPQQTPTSYPRVTTRKTEKRAATDVDKSFAEYLHAKRQQLNNRKSSNERQYDEKQMFLLSLLPEIADITDTQMRSFRRKVLQLIDDIRNPQYLSNVPNYHFTPTDSHSSISLQSPIDGSSNVATETHLSEDHSGYYNIIREALEN